MSEQSAELQALCELAIEQRLDGAQQRRLEELMLAPEARAFYVRYLHLHACLQWSGVGDQPPLTARSTPPPSPLPWRCAASPEAMQERGSKREAPLTPNPVRGPQRGEGSKRFGLPLSCIASGDAAHRQGRGLGGGVLPGGRRTLAAALLALAAGLVVVVWFAQRSSTPVVATLESGKACTWAECTLPTQPGASLTAGRLRLAEGLAKIVFASGAEVTLEAPADLELLSAKRCVLHGGRLVAKVPPRAIGFIVDTPTAILLDQGTEFGVHVRDGQTADVSVFAGLVDAYHQGTGKKEHMTTGQRLRFRPDSVAVYDPRQDRPPQGGRSQEGTVVRISTATGRGKDAYVQPLYPSKHHSDILLLVKNTISDSDYNRKAYLGLDLHPLAGKTIADAELSFTFAPTGMGFASEVPDATFAVYGLTDAALDNWQEKTLRWRNAPANQPGGAALDAGKATLLGRFLIKQGEMSGTRRITGAALCRFLQRDTNRVATFVVVRETPGSGRSDLVHGFANKNHPSLPPPTLTATLAARP